MRGLQDVQTSFASGSLGETTVGKPTRYRWVVLIM